MNQEEYIKELERENELLKKKLEDMRRPAPLNIKILEVTHTIDQYIIENSMEFIQNKMIRNMAEDLKKYICVEKLVDNYSQKIILKMRLYIHKPSQDEM